MKCRTCGTTLSAGALLCGECGTSAIAPRPTLGDTARYDRKALLEAIAVDDRPAAPEPVHTDAPAPSAAPGPETPRSARATALFSLVFSTGESVRVSGGGLIGRNPAPAEGERFDYVVQIVDPARSVSKTHLEFGVDGDGFWIADRGSANGTRLDPDHLDPIELRVGERIHVPRGARVAIGDQHFDVH